MKLVLGKEGQPADAVLLVLAKLGLDINRYRIRDDFASIQELGQEVTLLLSTLQEFFWEAWRVRKASLVIP